MRAPCSWCQRDAGDRLPQTRGAVSTDYAGKCILIADVLTLIERNILPDRPVFFITAGRRGAGKTTTLNMLVMRYSAQWPGQVRPRFSGLAVPFGV